MIVAFDRHTLQPLDDCLYALQPSIPALTRSSLHRCLPRRGISRLPDTEGDQPQRSKFKRYPIGYFHIDFAGIRRQEGGLYLFVAIDRTSKRCECINVSWESSSIPAQGPWLCQLLNHSIA